MRRSCELVTALSLLAALFYCVPATAASGPVPDKAPAKPLAGAPAKPELSRAQRLDALYAKLKRQANPDAAQQIVESIRTLWQESGSPTVDLLMQWSEKAAGEKHYATALDLLDQVTVLEPGYAEGWNERATVHFLMNDYSKAMADIDRTLSLEPRHFGALSGMASIFKALGKDRLAMESLEKVLAIYPADRKAQERLGELADKLAGESI